MEEVSFEGSSMAEHLSLEQDVGGSNPPPQAGKMVTPKYLGGRQVIRDVRSSLLNDPRKVAQSPYVDYDDYDGHYGRLRPMEYSSKIDCPIDTCIWTSYFDTEVGLMTARKEFNDHALTKHPRRAMLLYRFKQQ